MTYDLYNLGLAEGLGIQRESVDTSGSVLRVTPPPRFAMEETGSLNLRPAHDRCRLASSRWMWTRPGFLGAVIGSSNSYPPRRSRSAACEIVTATPGIGASCAASLARGEASREVIGSNRIGPGMRVPVTVLMRLEDARASLAAGQVARAPRGACRGPGRERDDRRTRAALEFDTTAALADQLEGSPIYDTEFAGFFRGGALLHLAPRDRAQDGIFMLAPYRPGKIPVVLVHGTASSPARWAELVNELEGDPQIMRSYQIWLFIYDSGNPIGYSAGRLRSALSATVQELDPQGQDPALQHMVVIGHSQGGCWPSSRPSIAARNSGTTSPTSHSLRSMSRRRRATSYNGPCFSRPCPTCGG